MARTDPKVDAHIENAALFAQPILRRIRKLYHKACPEIEETLKWGMPGFERHGLVGTMAAFKKHVNYSFWKAGQMSDPAGLFEKKPDGGVCMIKVADLKGLPKDKIFLAYIKEAVKLNEHKAAAPKSKKTTSKKRSSKQIKPPTDFAAALKKNKKAQATFDEFSYSHRKEYVQWITEAKKQETRERRIKQAIEMLHEGKSRNWKYQTKK